MELAMATATAVVTVLAVVRAALLAVVIATAMHVVDAIAQRSGRANGDGCGSGKTTRDESRRVGSNRVDMH